MIIKSQVKRDRPTRVRILNQAPKTFCFLESLLSLILRIARTAVHLKVEEPEEVHLISQSMILISNGYKELIKS